MTDELKALFEVSTRIREYEAAADLLKVAARLLTDVQVRATLQQQGEELAQTAGKWRHEQDQELSARQVSRAALRREELGPVAPAAALGLLATPHPRAELVGLVRPAPTAEELAEAAARELERQAEARARFAESTLKIHAEVRRQVGSCGTVFGSGQRCGLAPDHPGAHQ